MPTNHFIKHRKAIRIVMIVLSIATQFIAIVSAIWGIITAAVPSALGQTLLFVSTANTIMLMIVSLALRRIGALKDRSYGAKTLSADLQLSILIGVYATIILTLDAHRLISVVYMIAYPLMLLAKHAVSE